MGDNPLVYSVSVFPIGGNNEQNFITVWRYMKAPNEPNDYISYLSIIEWEKYDCALSQTSK